MDDRERPREHRPKHSRHAADRDPFGGQADAEFDQVDAARIAPADRRARLVFAIGALFLALAVLKPWTMWPGVVQPVPADPASATEAPAATAIAEILGRIAGPADDAYAATNPDDCPDSAWLIVVDDVTVASPTRSWIAAGATLAVMSPGDRGIPFTRLVSRQVRDLGFCSPLASDQVTGWTGTLWRLTSGVIGATSWQVAAHYRVAAGRLSDLLPPPLTSPASASSPEASSGSAASVGSTWPSGRYVLEAEASDGSGNAWVGIDLVTGR